MVKQNITFALRTLLKHKGFTLTAVLTLAVTTGTPYGVEALDVRAFGAVSFLLLVAALVACLYQAWRASRVEPLEALRYE